MGSTLDNSSWKESKSQDICFVENKSTTKNKSTTISYTFLIIITKSKPYNFLNFESLNTWSMVWKQEEKHMDVVKPERANGKESGPNIFILVTWILKLFKIF